MSNLQEQMFLGEHTDRQLLYEALEHIDQQSKEIIQLRRDFEEYKRTINRDREAIWNLKLPATDFVNANELVKK